MGSEDIPCGKRESEDCGVGVWYKLCYARSYLFQDGGERAFPLSETKQKPKKILFLSRMTFPATTLFQMLTREFLVCADVMTEV